MQLASVPKLLTCSEAAIILFFSLLDERERRGMSRRMLNFG